VGDRGPYQRRAVGRSKRELVRDHLREMITARAVGAAMPPERQLATELNVSRVTLRRAIEDLEREGLLHRRQGSGTFVTKPKIAQPLTMTSFTTDMRRRGYQPGARTLSLEVVPAGALVGRRLEVSPRTRMVRVRRLRLADDESMAIETLHVPEEVVPGLSAEDLEQHGFYDLLETRYGVRPDHALQTIEPTVTSPEESDLLGVPELSPAFLFERTTRSADGRVIEFVRSIYRGDRYKLVTELLSPGARPRRHGLAGAS
jgi:GntR family transcriptional regulator